jgi:hypothetical protein
VFEELGRQLGKLGERVSHLELAVAGLQLGRGPVSGVFVVGFPGVVLGVGVASCCTGVVVSGREEVRP